VSISTIFISLQGGGPYFIVVQLIAIISLTLLGFLGAIPIIWLTDKIIPIRLDAESEEKGCDIVEHGINEVPEIPSYLGDIESIKLSAVKFDEQNQLSITMAVNPNYLSGSERIFQDSLRQRSQTTNANFGGNGRHVRHIFSRSDSNDSQLHRARTTTE
jgi:hypothetical protein